MTRAFLIEFQVVTQGGKCHEDSIFIVNDTLNNKFKYQLEDIEIVRKSYCYDICAYKGAVKISNYICLQFITLSGII